MGFNKRNSTLSRVMKMLRRKRKTSSSEKKNASETIQNEIVDGVFYNASASNEFDCSAKELSDSCSTIDTILSNFCESSSKIESSSWKSSDSPYHPSGAPLLVRSAISQRHLGGFVTLSDEEVLGRIMLTSKSLPRSNDGGFVTSNHVMVHNERTKRTIVPLKRNQVMDEKAREHARQMAEQQSLFHTDPESLANELGSNRIGANVGRGTSVRRIHNCMVTCSLSSKNNMIDRRFVSIGVGTAKAADGSIYMCQIFSD